MRQFFISFLLKGPDATQMAMKRGLLGKEIETATCIELDYTC